MDGAHHSPLDQLDVDGYGPARVKSWTFPVHGSNFGRVLYLTPPVTHMVGLELRRFAGSGVLTTEPRLILSSIRVQDEISAQYRPQHYTLLHTSNATWPRRHSQSRG